MKKYSSHFGSVLLFVLASCCADGQTPVAAPAFTPPAHPVTAAQVRELVDLTHMRQNMESSIQHSIDAERKTMPYLPDVFFTDMQKRINQLDLIAMFEATYVKYISEEDAKGIIAFYKTPAGQNYLSAVPQMTQEVMDTFMEKGRSIGQQVAADHKAEMDQAIKQYQKDHPDAGAAAHTQ